MAFINWVTFISDGMSDIQVVVDKFSGFLTKEQAARLLEEGDELLAKQSNVPKKHFNARELLGYTDSKNTNVKNPALAESPINLKDRIYRIFNPTVSMINGKEAKRRKVILGDEGYTIVLNLKDRFSDLIDIQAFERGDTVTINNVSIDPNSHELKSIESTSISKTSPSRIEAIVDYSKIDSELRKIDLIGRMIEIGVVKRVNKLGRPGEMAVAECMITDSRSSVPASFWGSSALATEGIRTNETLKIEFCDVRILEGKMHVYARDDSRVIANPLFGNRLLGKN
jgi:hypothetical protein